MSCHYLQDNIVKHISVHGLTEGRKSPTHYLYLEKQLINDLRTKNVDVLNVLKLSDNACSEFKSKSIVYALEKEKDYKKTLLYKISQHGKVKIY